MKRDREYRAEKYIDIERMRMNSFVRKVIILFNYLNERRENGYFLTRWKNILHNS